MQHLALISARTGVRRCYVPDLLLNAAVADGLGGWLVGGRNGLAHLRDDGHVDPTWGARPAREVDVSLLVRSGFRLYVEVSRRIEAFNTRSGVRLWVSRAIGGSVDPPVSPTVHALAASSTRVYLAGNFTRVGGVARRSLATLDARTGRLLDWGTPLLRNGDGPDAKDAYVSALALAGTRIYVGGVFSRLGRQPRSGLAALDARTGFLLPWRPANEGGDVDVIFVIHGQVATAGHDSFGVFDARTGRRVPWTSRLGGFATTFGSDGHRLYLGGGLRNGFDSAGGQPRRNLAALDLAKHRFTHWGPNLAPFVQQLNRLGR